MSKKVGIILFVILSLSYLSFTSSFAQQPPAAVASPSAIKEAPVEVSEIKSKIITAEDVEKALSTKISLDLRDINILDVLKFLAQKGNLNIVTSKNINGRVTLFLNSVSIRDALDIILVANELGYVKKNAILYVMTEAEFQGAYGKKFADNRKVEITKLEYASPTYAFTVLDSLKSTIGKVIVDEGTGVVVIVDTVEKIKEMSKAIQEMDNGKMETRIFTLQYAKTEDVVGKIRPKLEDKKVGTVVGDARSSQVIVSALPERMPEMAVLIKSLDKKTKEVLIEIRILKLVLNPQFDMGINWTQLFHGGKDTPWNKLKLAGTFPMDADLAAVGTLGTISYGTLGAGSLAAQLKALKQISDSKILANPRITVTDGEEAKIHIGDKLAYVTTATTQGGSGPTTTAESVSFVDIGIQMNVTPKINDNGYVTMKIKPEISSKTGDYTSPSGNKIPLINTTLAETSVMVEDGTTIIIGGLRKDERTHTKRGLPFLMDIPWVGRAFSTVTDEITKTEIAIFLTPHIVGGDLNITDQKGEIKDEEKEY